MTAKSSLNLFLKEIKMRVLFWTLWTSEFILTCWWLLSEIKLRYLKPNPYAFLSLLWLLVTPGVRFGLNLPEVSLWMVGIPSIPLAGMLLIIIVAALTGARWK